MAKPDFPDLPKISAFDSAIQPFLISGLRSDETEGEPPGKLHCQKFGACWVISVKITDLTSEVLFERTFQSAYKLEIPVSQLKAGVYFLYVNDKIKTIVMGE